MSTRRFDTGGFSLVEVTLALGVAAFCLVAVFGLLPTALQVQSTATEETASIGIASAIAADLRGTPRESPASQRFSIPIGSETTLFFTAEGEPSASLAGDSRYRITVTFPPNGGGARSAIFANVRVSWPAPAAPARAAGSRTSFVAIDRS